MNKQKNDEVRQKTLEYFEGNELLTNIWLSKYCLKDKSGTYLEETPYERIEAVIREVVRIDMKHYYEYATTEGPLPDLPDREEYEKRLFKEYRELLHDFRGFIPGGSILFGVGNENFLSTLGNCFVIGNEVDSYGSICLIDQEQIQLMKRRGGVGHDLSHLRPKGTPVNGCANTSTGAFSFVPRYSNSTREVAQDGRRGALMLSAHVNHPDIEGFITCKDVEGKNTGANVSVKVTDQFMNAVMNNLPHYFHFPINNPEEWGQKPAVEIFNKIVHQAWKNGEPGILFWDTIKRESPADCYSKFGFKTISTNPCGEIPLSAYDSCRLGHINLLYFVENPFTVNAGFDWGKFRNAVRTCQRFMDSVIDLEIEKLDKIIQSVDESYEDEMTKMIELNLWRKVKDVAVKGRRTGLGSMGMADTLAALGIKYGSKEGNRFLVEVQKMLCVHSYMASIELASTRGAFPVFDAKLEKENPFINRVLEEVEREYPGMTGAYLTYGRRNISNLTIAPTGTTSQLAMRKGVSSGMEPVFELIYHRRKKITENDREARVDFIDADGEKFQEYLVIHPQFESYLQSKYVFTSDLSEERLEQLKEESPWAGCTANEMDVIAKIDLQGQLQKWVDHSISVTHNLPKTATEEEIGQYYMEAWKRGCKGCTVYRDGSRGGVLVKKDNEFKYADAQKRPEVVECDIHKGQFLNQNWFIIVGKLNENPYEIFAVKAENFPSQLRSLPASVILKGKTIKRKKKVYDVHTSLPGKDEIIVIKDIVSLMDNNNDRADTKRFSLDLRHRINPLYIVETVEKQAKEITSFEKAICRVLRKYLKDGTHSGLTCESCGSTNMVYSSGCPVCLDCGFSHCG